MRCICGYPRLLPLVTWLSLCFSPGACILGLKILSSDGDNLLGWTPEECSQVIARLLEPVVMSSHANTTSNPNNDNEDEDDHDHQVASGLSRLAVDDRRALVAVAKSLIKSTKSSISRDECPFLYDIVEACR